MKKYVKRNFFVEQLCQLEKKQFIQYLKLNIIHCIIYGDIESLINKIDNCKNIPEKSSTTKTEKHVTCRYSILTTWAFNHIKNKRYLHWERDFIEKFCECL